MFNEDEEELEIPGDNIDLGIINKYYEVMVVDNQTETSIRCVVVENKITSDLLPCKIDSELDFQLGIRHQVQVSVLMHVRRVD